MRGLIARGIWLFRHSGDNCQAREYQKLDIPNGGYIRKITGEKFSEPKFTGKLSSQ
jgi:hypothetical protein